MALKTQAVSVLIHYSSQFASVVRISMVSSYCADIIYLILSAESGCAKGSSSYEYIVHGLEDEASFLLA